MSRKNVIKIGLKTVQADPSWFVDGCPLEPETAVEALARRHGLASASEALQALHEHREALEARGDAGAEALSDLPPAR